jgi:hypothetical protein
MVWGVYVEQPVAGVPFAPSRCRAYGRVAYKDSNRRLSAVTTRAHDMGTGS